MYSGTKKYLLYVIAITLLCLISCGTQNRYEILSFFFDGVPPPPASEMNPLTDSLLVLDSTNLSARSNKTIKSIFLFHSPYQKKKCTSCHDQKSYDKIIESQPGLCYKCHEDFKERFKFIHGPVGGGYCTSCHDPHKAKLEKLLIRPTQQQCLYCHDSSMLFNNKFHKNREETNCLECHNPHGGENRFIPQHGSCYKCHNDFKKEYNFLHGPVAGEYCTSCHSTHIEDKKALLISNGNQLCLDCHNKTLINKSEYHKNKETYCIECHDPHGGKNRFFMKLN